MGERACRAMRSASSLVLTGVIAFAIVRGAPLESATGFLVAATAWVRSMK
jgi:hypothetical protein